MEAQKQAFNKDKQYVIDMWSKANIYLYIVIISIEKQTFSKLNIYAKFPAELKEKTMDHLCLSCCGLLACNSDHFIILFLVKLNMQQASKNC